MAGLDYGHSYPAPWSRVARQLAAECRHVEMVTAYEWSGFMQAPGGQRPLLDTRAGELFQSYQTHLCSTKALPRLAGN